MGMSKSFVYGRSGCGSIQCLRAHVSVYVGKFFFSFFFGMLVCVYVCASAILPFPDFHLGYPHHLNFQWVPCPGERASHFERVTRVYLPFSF